MTFIVALCLGVAIGAAVINLAGEEREAITMEIE